MSSYHIRKYTDVDYQIVRNLYVQSVNEHIPTLAKYALTLTRVRIFLLVVPIALFMACRSFLLSATAAALLVALVWHGASHFFNTYIDRYFKEDMRDIQESYMQRKGSCFWVAESNGDIIGIVGALPCEDGDRANKVAVKHMSVSGAHRQKGIGKALCQTLLSFAKQEGYESVILETTMIQHAGQKLYESLGFKRTHCSVAPHFFARMLHLLMVSYRYDIPRHS